MCSSRTRKLDAEGSTLPKMKMTLRYLTMDPNITRAETAMMAATSLRTRTPLKSLAMWVRCNM